MKDSRYNTEWIARYTHHALAAALVLGLMVSGCDNKRTNLSEEQAEKGLGLPTSHSGTEKIDIDPRCEANDTIVDPTANSPEAIIKDLLDASQMEDAEAGFEKFYAHFDQTKVKRDWAKKQYWPRARKHVKKYLAADQADGTVFRVCERRKKNDSELKIFIQSNDPKKSNPPITFGKQADGSWKVIFYTP